jgi:DNA-binding NarL/FixJ family response regulator
LNAVTGGRGKGRSSGGSSLRQHEPRAADCSPRSGAPDELEAATFCVAADKYVIFSHRVSQMQVPGEVTQAERDVCVRLLRGQGINTIATERNSSLSTVRNQGRALYRKLKVSSWAELAVRCSTPAVPRCGTTNADVE